ncbi:MULTISPECIES: LPXTG cell wall anchor domain-containing protein [Streptomyces]|uniref:LPXTG cell wall anchor domain-containing protein n=1 Tax=Streptomyces TaxID=1883 RepID=UPI0010726536|nr:LPXTG cell wall anchor domain-containing protein [Streptomyces sp. 4R-3d]TFI28998.1 LPXTG cell wall anchor domain-containing protein [Streptomyces sp. 4R-3d]
MPIPPRNRRTSRTAVAALSAAGLVAMCAAAPTAFADEAAPELVLGDVAPVEGVKPGTSFDPSLVVANKGTKAVDKVWVSYSVTRGLDYAEIPSNCEAHQVPSYDEMTEKSNVVCAFEQALEPGVLYEPKKPLAIKALDRALNDDLRMTVRDYYPDLDEAATTPVAGTAPAVELVERAAGGDATKDFVDVPVTTVNKADYEVTGADLKGAVGDTVTLKAKFRNAGPAWVLTREGDPLVEVLITPPAGTSVVKPDGFCEAKGKALSCGTSQRWVDEGGGETYTIKLKIDKELAGAKGSVALSTEDRLFDPDKTNDKAEISLDVTGGGSTGSPGSTDSTGGSSSTGSSSSSGGNDPTTNNAHLAETGSSSPALPLALGAVAAVAVGAGSLFAVRRRRAQHTG